MREQERIQFRGDTAAFEDYWNARYEPKIELGLIALYKDQPEYARLKRIFANFAEKYPMTWSGHTYADYSEEDLASHVLFALHIIGRAGKGNNDLAEVYSTEQTCTNCGRLAYRQIRNLMLNPMARDPDPYEVGYFEHDLCETEFNEVVVSDKVRRIFEAHGAPGMRFRAVDSVTGQPSNGWKYHQLLADVEVGPLVAPSPVQRLDLCPACGQYRQVLLTALPGTVGSEFYFPASSYSGKLLMQTTDRFGRVPNFASKLVISQEGYRLFRQNGVTGYRVQPAHLV